MMWPFKWKLSAYTFTRCCLFLKILENEICKFGRNLRLATFGSERVKRASTGSQVTTTRPYSLWGLRNFPWMTKLQLPVTKNKLLKTVRLTSFQKPQLKSVSISSTFSIRCSLNFVYLLSYLYLLVSFERSFLCFTQFGESSHCLNFDKFRDAAFQVQHLIESPGLA